MEFVPIAVFAALLWKLNDFFNAANERHWNDVRKQAVAWVSGVIAAFLVAQTQFAEGVEVWNTTLADLNSVELLLVGLMATSLASVGHDTVRAIERKKV